MKRILILIGLVFFVESAISQTDSTKGKWYIPNHGKIQYAGEIGFLSVGLGKSLFTKNQGELDLMYGFVPKSLAGHNISTVAIRFNYLPWEVQVPSIMCKVNPLYIGLQTYYSFGSSFRRREGYYSAPLGHIIGFGGFRLGPIIGSRTTLNIDNSAIKFVSFCFELTANDIYLDLWIDNPKTNSLNRMVNSSLGIKVGF